jgi:hypothetical protein
VLPGPCVDWTRGIEPLDVHDPDAGDDQLHAHLARRDVLADGADFDAGAVDVLSTSEVFVVRGRCGYLVGSFDSYSGVAVRHRFAHGLSDLVTTEPRPGPGGRTYQVTYRYDGRAYREVSRRRVADPRNQLREGQSF